MTEEENTSNEEQQYTIKDIDKLSLLDDTIVDLEDKEIDASSEIDGITLLKHGAVAETKPLNDNFIYINARTDNVVNSLSKYADAVAECNDKVEANNEVVEQLTNNINNDVIISSFPSADNEIGWDSGNHHDYRNGGIYVGSPQRILYHPYVNSHGAYWVNNIFEFCDYCTKKLSYKSELHKAINLPYEIECSGRMNFVVETSTSSAKLLIIPTGLPESIQTTRNVDFDKFDFPEGTDYSRLSYPTNIYFNFDNNITCDVSLSDISEDHYTNVLGNSNVYQYNSSTNEYEPVNIPYSSTGGFGNMTVNNAYDYSTHQAPNGYYCNVITIDIAKTSSAVNRRCTVTWTAKRTIPLGLMEIEEYDAP